MSKALSLQEVAEYLLSHERILLTAHQRPDGDAFGSVMGLQSFLKNAGKSVDALFYSPIPDNFQQFAGPILTKMTQRQFDQNYDLVVLLDCANMERADGGPELSGDFLRSRNLLCIDHHCTNIVNAPRHYIAGDAAATCEITTQLALLSGKPIPQEAATLWYLGLTTDTGSFRFSNTSARTLRIAANLLDARADRERVLNAVFFSKTRNEQLFETEFLQNQVKSAFGGRYIYASVPDELANKYHIDQGKSDDLVDLLRELDTAVIVAKFYLRDGGCKVSLRSKSFQYPVCPIAQSLGGGGHKMAAGINLPGKTLAEAEALLLEKITPLFEPSSANIQG